LKVRLTKDKGEYQSDAGWRFGMFYYDKERAYVAYTSHDGEKTRLTIEIKNNDTAYSIAQEAIEWLLDQ